MSTVPPASAFPRLSPSAQRVVAGEDVVVVDRAIEIGRGTGAQWATEDRLHYTRQPDGAFVTTVVGSGLVQEVRREGFALFSAPGMDHWAGYRAGTGVVFSNGLTVPAWSDPALSEDRAVWAVRVIAGGGIETESGRPSRFADRDCVELRYARRALAWTVVERGFRWVAGRTSPSARPERLSLDESEGWPVPFYVGDALWLLTLAATRLLLRPWGESHGYVVATLNTFTPDAAALPDGRIRVVWDAGGDVLGGRVIDPADPRVDLRLGVPPPPPPPPPPEDEVNKPGIDVVDYARTIHAGQDVLLVHWKDRNNPGHERKVRIVNGSLKVEDTVDGWNTKSDYTGASRPITVQE